MATRLVVTYCLCFPQSERTYYLPLSQTLVQSMTNPFFSNLLGDGREFTILF